MQPLDVFTNTWIEYSNIDNVTLITQQQYHSVCMHIIICHLFSLFFAVKVYLSTMLEKCMLKNIGEIPNRLWDKKNYKPFHIGPSYR